MTFYTFRRWRAAAIVTACMIVVVGSGRLAGAQDADAPPNEFSFGIGYANISIGGSDSLLNSEDALRFEGMYSYAPFANLPQLRLGAAFGMDMVLDNSEFIIISNGGAVIAGHANIPLLLLEPEFRVSWQQYLGNEQNFYIEPGVGIGGVLANLNIDSDDSSTGQSFDEWESTFTVRAFVNVGFHVEGGVAGLQASYMRGGSLNFADNAKGDIDEFYIGIYGALRF